MRMTETDAAHATDVIDAWQSGRTVLLGDVPASLILDPARFVPPVRLLPSPDPGRPASERGS
jgi:hypothetical protein